MPLDLPNSHEAIICKGRTPFLVGTYFSHFLTVLLLTEDMILALAGQFKQLSHEP